MDQYLLEDVLDAYQRLEQKFNGLEDHNKAIAKQAEQAQLDITHMWEYIRKHCPHDT